MTNLHLRVFLFLALQPERRQTEDPQRLAVSPGPGNHPAAVSGHRGGQASLLQTVRCLCFWVSRRRRLLIRCPPGCLSRQHRSPLLTERIYKPQICV